MGKPYVLKTEGKVVTVRPFKGEGMKMCAVDYLETKPTEHVVHIHKRTDNNKQQMAFHFLRSGISYCVKVVNKDLMVEKANNPEETGENQWFVMHYDGDGDNYSLSPVVAPTCCLAVLSEKPYTFLLSDQRSDCVQVTAEII